MGQQDVKPSLHGEQLRSFMAALLRDLQALESMLANDMIERGRHRIGAEQEMFLVDESCHPARKALEILERLDDPHFTTELAQFNLEANLDPLDFDGSCLREMEEQLNTLLAKARTAAAEVGTRILLTGILPTIRKSDLELDNITPNPRYYALNDALTSLRGGAYEFRIRGIDDLLVRHDSVMVESCNASFQAHLQVEPEEFARLYNIAQVIAAPTLAAVTNSPLLFGKRLWAETRIALFEQAVDTRNPQLELRELPPRVWFGSRYVERSVTEIYKEDIARFRALLGLETNEDPFEVMQRGDAPRLRALCLHNGTVYRWNRACYGVTNGRPHLRIENRVIPSGPTPLDEVANAAFWLGLMRAMSVHFQDITRFLPFELANANFHAAAQQGLSAQFVWLEGETLPAKVLLERLVPMAREGLESCNVDGRDIDRYLGVIAERVDVGQTGAHWSLRSMNALKEQGRNTAESLAAIVGGMVARQYSGRPVHQWDLAEPSECGDWKYSFRKVEHFMTTDLFTVQEDEPVDLVANLMDWNRIRHVLVEDQDHRLVGLISYRSLLRVMAGRRIENGQPLAVAEIMTRGPICVSPDTPTLEVLNLMRQHKIACVPVVKGTQLVGVVTERDFMDITAELLEQRLRT